MKARSTVEMTPKERLLATAAFEPLDRPYMWETLGYWNETLDRWHGEGLPAEINEVISANLYFGVDAQLPVMIGDSDQPGFFPLFEEEVVEQTDEYVIKRDPAGSLVRVLASGQSTIPAWLESPVKDRESWEALKWRLDPEAPGRLDNQLMMAEFPGGVDWPLWVYATGLFGTLRMLFGFTPLVLAYRKQPELVHEMSRHWADFWRSVISRIAEKRVPDAVYLWEDMCYKNGPMIGPRVFEEFMSPYYNDLVGFLRNELGVPIVNVDTDGDCLLLVPKFVEAGVNMILPWEVQAGMDVVAIREQWPTQFVINGGIDKRALYTDRAAIDAEVMRVLPPMLAKGGYIPALDHLVPPEVPLDNYRYFLELVREVGVKACSGAA